MNVVRITFYLCKIYFRIICRSLFIIFLLFLFAIDNFNIFEQYILQNSWSKLLEKIRDTYILNIIHFLKIKNV